MCHRRAYATTSRSASFAVRIGSLVSRYQGSLAPFSREAPTRVDARAQGGVSRSSLPRPSATPCVWGRSAGALPTLACYNLPCLPLLALGGQQRGTLRSVHHKAEIGIQYLQQSKVCRYRHGSSGHAPSAPHCRRARDRPITVLWSPACGLRLGCHCIAATVGAPE